MKKTWFLGLTGDDLAVLVLGFFGAFLVVRWSVFGVLIAVIFVLPVIISVKLGVSRQRTGWMWGLFLGWLGVFILACMRAQPPISVRRD